MDAKQGSKWEPLSFPNHGMNCELIMQFTYKVWFGNLDVAQVLVWDSRVKQNSNLRIQNLPNDKNDSWIK